VLVLVQIKAYTARQRRIHEETQMKILVLATALIAAVAVAAPAEAASKKKKRVAAAQQATTVSQDTYMVRAADGDVLGADPDPFIRMMIRKEGRIRDQSGI
jgi:hypothetical protein